MLLSFSTWKINYIIYLSCKLVEATFKKQTKSEKDKMTMEKRIKMKSLKITVRCVWGDILITSFFLNIKYFLHHFN